jgi:hypothetical protein
MTTLRQTIHWFLHRLCLLLLIVILFVPLVSASGNLQPQGELPSALAEPPRMPSPPAGWSAGHIVSASASHCSLPYCDYLPVVQRPPDSPNDRQYSRDLYHSVYLASTPAVNWTGSYNPCNPGTTNAAFRAAILTRINYFREMAGIPKVVRMLDAYNQESQAAALIMSAEGDLSHDPPTNWPCWTQLGHDGAGSSNLYLGVYGPEAISGYIDDYGISSMGHRRWILYPQTQEMGTGDIPSSSSHWSSNSLHVFDDKNMWGPRPTVRDDFIAWPPPVYVPYQVVYAYWTFSYPSADFSSTTITVTKGGSSLAITKNAQENGYGENTLVWKINSVSGAWPKPTADTVYTVTLKNVMVNSVAHNFSYQVTIFDPGT